MRFSVWPRTNQSWDDIRDLALHAESTGWDGVYIADHFMPNAPEPADGVNHECWSIVAALGAVVPRIRIGTLVVGNTYRHPAVLLKQAVTADIISGGRVVFGLGAGWQENEHRAYGLEFSTVGGRLSMLEEACQVVRSLLADGRANFAGTYYTLTDAPLDPGPAGPFPLLIGGGGEKRTMRIAAQYADEWNVWGEPDLLRQKGGVLERHCADLGRDHTEIARSTQALLFHLDDADAAQKMLDSEFPMARMVGTSEMLAERIAEYRDAGVDEIIVPDFTLGDGNARLEAYDRFYTDVARQFQD